MSHVPTEIGVDILIALSTGLSLLVAATVIVRIFRGVLARGAERPRPTIGTSFLVAVAGGVIVLPFFLLLDAFASKPVETKPFETDSAFRITDEENRARRAGIESLRNHLLMSNRGELDEKTLPPLFQRRSRGVWTIPYASGMCYSHHPDASDGPYLALEPEILDGKRYAVERNTFNVVELPEGGTE